MINIIETDNGYMIQDEETSEYISDKNGNNLFDSEENAIDVILNDADNRDAFFLSCPRIDVTGEVKYITMEQFDLLKGDAWELMEVHYDLSELANEHNRGDAKCEFSPKQIYRYFNGDDEQIITFYKKGLEQNIFKIISQY